MEIEDVETKQGSGPFQIGTITCAGVIDVSPGTKSQDDYIKKYLINEIGQIVKCHQELSWVLMVAGIELLGRCIDSKPDSVADSNPQNNRPYFRAGLKLFRKEYQKYNTDNNPHDLWKFRCDLSHLTFATGLFTISEKTNKGKHLSIDVGGRLVLVAEDFYEDFKTACEKVLEMRKNNQINSKFYLKTV